MITIQIEHPEDSLTWNSRIRCVFAENYSGLLLSVANFTKAHKRHFVKTPHPLLSALTLKPSRQTELKAKF